MLMADHSHLMEAVAAIRSRSGITPLLAVVLGSGLGAVAHQIEGAMAVPYGDIPGFPRPTVPGHRGELVLGTLEGIGVAAMKGRSHLYEGYTPAQIGFPVQVLHRLGVRTLMVTNAAGGLSPDMDVGTLMVLEDHLNLPGLAGMSPLVGVAGGPERFVNMSDAYDPSLRRLVLEGARTQGIRAASGVYAMVFGPSYETPAEARMLRLLGADAVGMSTVPEVLVARWLGMAVLGISCITNVLLRPVEHGEAGHSGVLSVAENVAPALAALLRLVASHIRVMNAE